MRYSEKIYQVIRDSDKAKLLRSEYRENMKDIVKGLKNKRIKKYDLKEDELTGEKLITKTCEFSHIRSYSVFPEYAEDIENGLIVNKTTHKIITKEGIQDEDELFNLCESEELNWKIDWYEKYKQKFR